MSAAGRTGVRLFFFHVVTCPSLTTRFTVNAASALSVLPKLDKGDPKATESCPPHPTCSNEKAQRLLGMKFRTVPETFKEVYEYFDARGWLADLQG